MGRGNGRHRLRHEESNRGLHQLRPRRGPSAVARRRHDLAGSTPGAGQRAHPVHLRRAASPGGCPGGPLDRGPRGRRALAGAPSARRAVRDRGVGRDRGAASRSPRGPGLRRFSRCRYPDSRNARRHRLPRRGVRGGVARGRAGPDQTGSEAGARGRSCHEGHRSGRAAGASRGRPVLHGRVRGAAPSIPAGRSSRGRVPPPRRRPWSPSRFRSRRTSSSPSPASHPRRPWSRRRGPPWSSRRSTCPHLLPVPRRRSRSPHHIGRRQTRLPTPSPLRPRRSRRRRRASRTVPLRLRRRPPPAVPIRHRRPPPRGVPTRLRRRPRHAVPTCRGPRRPRAARKRPPARGPHRGPLAPPLRRVLGGRRPPRSRGTP